MRAIYTPTGGKSTGRVHEWRLVNGGFAAVSRCNNLSVLVERLTEVADDPTCPRCQEYLRQGSAVHP